MLISEAVRGEGGRLFYLEGAKRVYFMEDKYGSQGNLMPRDVVSREMAATGREVFLDASFLGEKLIDERLSEARDVCLKYRGIDMAKTPIPVAPSVHFFMGGIAVDNHHETNIENLFAVGECASIYHGANRLGGNSLLSAIYGGWTAADAIAGRSGANAVPDFTAMLHDESQKLALMRNTRSVFPVMYMRDLLAKAMAENLGIVRDEHSLENGISDVDYYLSIADELSYDPNVLAYANYSLSAILVLARAVLECAVQRRESRGAHIRCDYPDMQDSLCAASIVSYDDGRFKVWLDKDKRYER